MLPQNSKDVCEVPHMLGYYLTLYNHIINIDFNASAQLWFKHFSHYPLISKPCIFQIKGHHFVMIVFSGSNKSCLFLIVQYQWYLVISLKGIQETHLRIAYRCIHQLIYPRHREMIYGIGLIEVCEVHTHTPFSSFLFHYHCIS